MAEVYTEPTPSAFGANPADPGTPLPLSADDRSALDGLAAAFSRDAYAPGL